MRTLATILLACGLLPLGCRTPEAGTPASSTTPTDTALPRLEKQGSATRLIVNGNPLLMIAGELHNSTTGGLGAMRSVWKPLAARNLNTVLAPVSWELVEPEEGAFDFTLVDSMLHGAREADLKLILLWFGSWKNGGSVYVPSWVKRDYSRFPRARDEAGKPLEILSTFAPAAAEADARAFAALMTHLNEVDGRTQTVVMVQVQNEIGVLDNLGTSPGNARRDFVERAEEAYRGPVPEALLEYLVAHRDSLFPELERVWAAHGYKESGSWEEVFGRSTFRPRPEDWKTYSFYTEELFMAWSYARYVETVAAAGKRAYPLPMFVNAWLKQPFTYWPGRYPSGGPLPQVLDVWRAAAPSIDFIAPDIYTDEFVWICDEFTRGGNPLFIPETRGGALGAARALFAFGEYDAALFAPFGIDGDPLSERDWLAETYATLRNMAPAILEHQGRGTMRGILVDTTTPTRRIDLGDYTIEARLAGSPESGVAGGLVLLAGPEEYYVAGRALDVFFLPHDPTMRVGVLAADEGSFNGVTWKPQTRLNGDETHASTWSGTGLKFPDDRVGLQKITLYRYR